MKNKVYTVLKENMALKKELESLVNLIKENESKHKGFQLVEDAFLTAESVGDIDGKALRYMEEIFDIDKAVLFIDSNALKIDNLSDPNLVRVKYTNEKTLKYAFVERRPYFGTYLTGLISDFHIMDEIGSYLIAPIVEDGKVIASLNLYSRNPEKLSGDAHSDFIRELIIRIGIALRKLHHAQTILYFAQYDFLTKVYNKAMMHSLLFKFIDRYKYIDAPFSFILMDMDNFKELNDTHGHIVGDEVLFEVATGIKALLNDSEVFGRFGGDEFYAMVNLNNAADVKSLFAKIVAMIDEIAKRFNMVGKLGISGGFVCVPKDIDVYKSDPIDIVKMADVGLYQSKASGKRICSAYIV
ncbi:MAG: sensor domain-containing diguanylate cyclase [Deferribacteraceae bacterium]|nr:sensor domain-containing diguanylate cyclase [Deferribacteraceae bacterium]